MDKFVQEKKTDHITAFVNAGFSVKLDRTEDVEKISRKKRIKVASSFAVYNSCNVSFKDGKYFGSYAIESKKSDESKRYCQVIDSNGGINITNKNANSIGFCPIVSLNIPTEKELKNLPNNFSRFKGFSGLFKRSNPTMLLGSYPQKSVSSDISDVLEGLYNNGNLKDGIEATGKVYSLNAKNLNVNSLTKLCPEFEYNGVKYVRFKSNAVTTIDASTLVSTKPNWFVVSPVYFHVKNWNEMPKYINPRGNGNAKKMELQTKDILIAGFPFESYGTTKAGSTEVNVNAHLDNFVKDIFGINKKRVRYVIPAEQNAIADFAFEGCTTLNEVVIHSNVRIGNNAFEGCGFKYAYFDNEFKNIILSKTMPTKEINYSKFADFNKIFKHIKGISLDDVLNMYVIKDKLKYSSKFFKFVDKLKSADISIPNQFLTSINISQSQENFYNSDFRFIKNEFPNLNKMLEKYAVYEQVAFWKFAYAFGCLSHDEFLGNNGESTGIYVAQKASSALAKFFKKDALNVKKISELIGSGKELLPYNKMRSQDLIKFMSTQGENGEFENLKLLVDLEQKQKGSFCIIANCFEKAKRMRIHKDLDGKLRNLPWQDVFFKILADKKYDNVTDENFEIAKVFFENGVSQKDFDKAIRLFRTAKSEKIRSHILKKHLNEVELIRDIENIQKETKQIIQQSAQKMQKSFKKAFTYEFLDKHDPKNAIIGLYCDCCAIVGGESYGSGIAKHSIISDDVQNLVVKDHNNEIVAKAAMYVNEHYGYAVLNEFEIAKKYKKNEGANGIYRNDRGQLGAIRKSIYDAFVRGVKKFVEEYDLEHPNNPIKQVTVGMNHNRLKRQCNKLKIAEKKLIVPIDYNFLDAREEQRVLYENSEALYEFNK